MKTQGSENARRRLIYFDIKDLRKAYRTKRKDFFALFYKRMLVYYDLGYISRACFFRANKMQYELYKGVL